MTTEQTTKAIPITSNDVLAVIDNPREAMDAARDLMKDGIHAADIAFVNCGVLVHLLEVGESHCQLLEPAGKRLWEHLVDEKVIRPEEVETRGAGPYIIAVHGHSLEDAERAAAILNDRGARHIERFAHAAAA